MQAERNGGNAGEVGRERKSKRKIVAPDRNQPGTTFKN